MRDLATPLVTAPMPSVVKPLSLSDKKKTFIDVFSATGKKNKLPFLL